MNLQPASIDAPPGLAELLLELGDGEGGFGGTSFARGEATLEQFLQSCIDGADAVKVPAGFVPMTTFWIIDDAGCAVGMVRMRHHLNDRLLQNGGHVGYYVRKSDRGKGYATQALGLAIQRLREMGVTRVLVTVSPDNLASIRVALANGGVLDEVKG